MFRNLRHRNKRGFRAKSSEDPDFDDTNMYRCKVCGFICNADKVNVRSTDKDSVSDLWADGNISYTSDDDDDTYIVIANGCPFCGSPDSR